MGRVETDNQFGPADGPLDADGQKPMPRHVAIIMDGNGRWAAQRGLPRQAGHQQGVEAVRRIVKASRELHLEYLTLFSFSSENWSRPATEIADLMRLLRMFIRRDLAELHEHNVRVVVIGRREQLDRDLIDLLTEAETLTQANTALNLVVAFNYGARDEIADAARHIALQVKTGTLSPDEITADVIADNLSTRDIPDPDLLIRTSGEKRISNFLLWQMAYTEFVFAEENWPDFGRQHLERAIDEYRGRDRRFGGLSTAQSV